MDLLPGEIIDMIGSYLDAFSAVRFSRTCQRVYLSTRGQIDKLMIPRKAVIDEIRKIKYDIYHRKAAFDDDFGQYCGIREIRGRLIGSVSKVIYSYERNIYGKYIRSCDDEVIIFSDDLHATPTYYDVDQIYSDSNVVFCQLYTSDSNKCRITIMYSVQYISAKGSRDSILRATCDPIGDMISNIKYSTFTICSRYPVIRGDEIHWEI